MATYPTTPRSEFLAWCEAHVDVFTDNTAAIGLTAPEALAFKNAVLAAAEAEDAQMSAKEAAKAATTTANQTFAALRKVAADTVGTIKIFAQSSNNPAVYATAQIPPPAAHSPVPPPGQPTDLTIGVSPTTGAITLKWKCANPAGASGTSYVVRRKLPSQNAFEFVGVTGKKTFTDSTFTAGPDSVQYTVQAQRSDKSGPVSPILTVNFGAQGGDAAGTLAVVPAAKVMKMAA